MSFAFELMLDGGLKKPKARPEGNTLTRVFEGLGDRPGLSHQAPSVWLKGRALLTPAPCCPRGFGDLESCAGEDTKAGSSVSIDLEAVASAPRPQGSTAHQVPVLRPETLPHVLRGCLGLAAVQRLSGRCPGGPVVLVSQAVARSWPVRSAWQWRPAEPRQEAPSPPH